MEREQYNQATSLIKSIEYYEDTKNILEQSLEAMRDPFDDVKPGVDVIIKKTLEAGNGEQIELLQEEKEKFLKMVIERLKKGIWELEQELKML